MALAKLRITPEREGTVLNFDGVTPIEAQFNPAQIALNKSVKWTSQPAKGRDVPEMQFNNGEPSTFSLDLFFDTYDSDLPLSDKKTVRELTSKVFALLTVEKHGDKHRPPVCRLSWGEFGEIFTGVLEQLDQQFIMFTENGRAVRAKLKCKFIEWRTHKEGIQKENVRSPDVAKVRRVMPGESLSSIAAEAYRDPALWRPIAVTNAIDDPLDIAPGTLIAIPTLPVSAHRRLNFDDGSTRL